MAVEAGEAPSNSAKEEGPKRPILEFAYARLARRAHSEGELSRKMRRAGYSREAISEAFEKLRALRYLDDAAFARDFATAARERKLWGPVRIAHRLRDWGIAETVIRESIENAFREGERVTANRALERFRRVYNQKGTAESNKAKAYRHLVSRGYSPEIAYEIIDREDEEQESGFAAESGSSSEHTDDL